MANEKTQILELPSDVVNMNLLWKSEGPSVMFFLQLTMFYRSRTKVYALGSGSRSDLIDFGNK